MNEKIGTFLQTSRAKRATILGWMGAGAMRNTVFALLLAVVGCRGGRSDRRLDLGPDLQISEGAAVMVAPIFDGDAAAHDFSWDFGDGVTAEGFSPRHVYVDEGTYSLRVTASRAGDVVATATAQVTVANVTPVLDLGPDRLWVPGRPFSLLGQAIDPGRRDLISAAVDWGDGVVEPVEVGGEGGLLARHTYDANGIYLVAVHVEDDDGASVIEEVSVDVADRQLLSARIRLRDWMTVGETIVGAVDAGDLVGLPLTVSLTGGPAGLTFDEATRRIDWTPAASQAGSHEVVVEVTDGVEVDEARATIVVSVPTPQASATIVASAGGTIEVVDSASPLFGVRLVVPAGALAADTTIAISTLVPPPPEASFLAGPAIELQPSGTTFAIPATLSVPFGAASHPTLTARGLYVLAPAEKVFHAQGSQWNPIRGATYDPATMLVTAPLAHFTSYQPGYRPEMRSYLSSGGHFILSWPVQGGEEEPLCTAAEIALRPGDCRTTPAARPYVSLGMDPDVKIPTPAYQDEFPDQVEDVAAILEASYEEYAGEYQLRADAPYEIELQYPRRFNTVLMMQGDRAFEAYKGLAGYLACISPWDLVQINPRRYLKDLKTTAAHELFHLAQCESDSAPYDWKWIAEATAEHKAVELFPQLLSETSGVLVTGGLDATSGYPAFSVLHALKTQKAFDLTREMYGIGGGVDNDFLERADSWFYRKIAEEIPDPAARMTFWEDFAFGQHYARTNVYSRDIQTWLGVRSSINGNAPTGAERRSSPLALRSFHNSVDATLPRGFVHVWGIDLDALCPVAGGLGSCTGTPDPKTWELVVRPLLAEGLHGRLFLVPHALPSDPAVTPAPILLGAIDGYTDMNDALSIPVAQLRKGYELVFVVVNDPHPYGLLTNGPALPASVQVEFRPGVRLSAGLTHACVLRDDEAYCWGSNFSGELGNGTPADGEPHPLPSQVVMDSVGTPLTGAFALAGNGVANHHCALTRIADGPESLKCWGGGLSNQLNVGPVMAQPWAVQSLTGDIRKADMYANHTCAVDEAGIVHCWGRNAWGALGNGVDDNNTSPNAPVAGVTGVVDVAGGETGSTCVVRTNGTIWCWGSNIAGELGIGTNVPDRRLTPGMVPGITNAIAIEGGMGFCALLVDGTVRCWGDNEAGQMGDGQSAPVFTPRDVGLENIVQLSFGWLHVCALDRDGVVHCWGYNDGYGLGHNGPARFNLPAPVAGMPPASEVAAGGDFTCAVAASDGQVWCWGWNRNGQLGDGAPVPGFPYGSRPEPAPIAFTP